MVDLLSVVTAGTSIAIDAGGTVDAASLLSAGTSVDVSGDDNVNLVEVDADGGDATIAGLNVNLTGPVDANGADTLITADNNVANSAALGGDGTTDNVTVRANTGWINSSAAITALADASLWAGDAITTTAAVNGVGVTVKRRCRRCAR